MADLDTLRPEVADAVSALDETTCMTNPGLKWYATVRTELLRLAAENAAARGALETLDVEGHKRAEKVEAELAEARETIKRLNRRVQVAEAGVAEKVKASAGRSLGRALANAAADTFMHERDEAQAELAALKDNHRGLLVGTTHDGRPYGLHGTHESVSAVSDELEELAALKARIAEAQECGVVALCGGGASLSHEPYPSLVGKLVRLVVEE